MADDSLRGFSYDFTVNGAPAFAAHSGDNEVSLDCNGHSWTMAWPEWLGLSRAILKAESHRRFEAAAARNSGVPMPTEEEIYAEVAAYRREKVGPVAEPGQPWTPETPGA